jgi:alkaline phosphatase
MPLHLLLMLALFALVPLKVAAAEAPAARNVILMISDGSGFNGWLATDYYEGKAGRQSYQRARPDGTTPYVGASAHDALRLLGPDQQVLDNGAFDVARGVEAQGYVPHERWTRLEGAFANDFAPVSIAYTSYTDSAAAGTALHTGRKTVSGRLNMNWDGSQRLQTIAHIAQAQSRATGAVATVQVSHATPASTLAQVPDRDLYADIFKQLADGRLDVLMGTGHPEFDESGRAVADPPESAFRFVGGRETWQALRSERGLNGYAYIESLSQFQMLADGQAELPRKLIGIPRTLGATQATREAYAADLRRPSRMAFNPEVPDLATMSRAALNVLQQNPNGFFVMIEGGAVDWMGHANDLPRFIEEQMDFNAAVAAVIDWVEAHSNWNETLLIVTSDHETGGIWGEGTFKTASGLLHPDPMDRSALTATQFKPGRDEFVEFLAVQDRGAGQIPGHQFASGNHTNDLVPLWALGAGAELFRGFERHDAFAEKLWGAPYGWKGNYVDNTAVFHVMKAVLVQDHVARQRLLPAVRP